jgi:ABC-type molybdenum transport system ATPase subunit/photorepair protein PhrA
MTTTQAAQRSNATTQTGQGRTDATTQAAPGRTPAPLLEVDGLHVEVDGKEILRGLTLTVRAGEVHAIMGPNGSGKSTLAHVLAGREGYTVTKGGIRYEGQDLLALDP